MNRYRGFTLIELIITVAIASIVLAVGVPSFQTMMRNNRAATYTNEFMSALNFARSEAVKRGRRVVLCPSTGTGNPPTCAGTAWESGWITFVDIDDDTVPNTSNDVLRIHGPLGGTTTLRGNANVATYILFSFDGTTRMSGNNNPQMGTLTFSLCNSNNQQNNIVINLVGRARVSQENPTTPCTY